MNSIIPQQQPPEFRSFVVPDLAMPPSILNMQNSRELNSITFNKGEKVYTKKENSDDEDMAATERPSSFFNSTAATRR